MSQLDKAMAWCLADNKPLPEPMLMVIHEAIYIYIEREREANIQFSKCLMILRLRKCLIYDEMVTNLPIFCLISPIFFAYIEQKWRFQELKWVMIMQNE